LARDGSGHLNAITAKESPPPSPVPPEQEEGWAPQPASILRKKEYLLPLLRKLKDSEAELTLLFC